MTTDYFYICVIKFDYYEYIFTKQRNLYRC